MDIHALAKKIRAAVMDSAEDQGRTFNASILDDVIAKELRLHMPAPSAPSAYPWQVITLTDGGKIEFGSHSHNLTGMDTTTVPDQFVYAAACAPVPPETFAAGTTITPSDMVRLLRSGVLGECLGP